MTFTQQLKEEYQQKFIDTFAQQLKEAGLRQDEYRKALLIARNLLKKPVPLSVIKSATGLSEQALISEDVC